VLWVNKCGFESGAGKIGVAGEKEGGYGCVEFTARYNFVLVILGFFLVGMGKVLRICYMQKSNDACAATINQKWCAMRFRITYKHRPNFLT
jgi:hypothetical protein